MQREEIVSTIQHSVSDVLRSKGVESVSLSENTEIFGSDSQIDSLDLVSVVVALEQVVLDRTGKQITLVDEKSLLTEPSPFRTVGSLAKLAMERIAVE